MDNFSKKSVRAILDSDAAYEILDSTAAEGSTWCAGACAILAFALNIAYGFPIYVIYDYDNKQADHFGVQTPNGAYIDCDGQQFEWLRNFRRKELYMHPQKKIGILPYTKELDIDGIVIDMEASKKLAELFKPTQVPVSKHTLHEGLFY
jgi:hypothetical protein